MEPKCHWEEIPEFRSLIQFQKFTTWITKRIKLNEASKVENPNFNNTSLQQEYFICNKCDTKWILTHPDPGYFAGSWRRVIS